MQNKLFFNEKHIRKTFNYILQKIFLPFGSLLTIDGYFELTRFGLALECGEVIIKHQGDSKKGRSPGTHLPPLPPPKRLPRTLVGQKAISCQIWNLQIFSILCQWVACARSAAPLWRKGLTAAWLSDNSVLSTTRTGFFYIYNLVFLLFFKSVV